MMRLDNGIDLSGGRSNRSAFFIVFGLLIAGFFIGQFVSTMFIAAFVVLNGGGLETLTDPTLLFESVTQTQFMIAQVFYTIVFTFLTPWLYLKILTKRSFGDICPNRETSLLPILLSIIGTVAFMFFNTILIEWNAGLHLPEFMSGVEQWMKDTEEQLAETTAMMTNFNSFGSFMLAFVVIAILPGIGEELLFRGLLQNSLHKWTKNAHIAIWVSGFIFAAIHLQFYGLVPRMMLGVVFGYLYVWSGNIWFPIIAHITNNGLALILTYMYQLNASELDIDDTESVPELGSVVGLVVFVAVFYLFRKHFIKPKVAL
jgi:membrane protease YdiL (CAAX protease family)